MDADDQPGKPRSGQQVLRARDGKVAGRSGIHDRIVPEAGTTSAATRASRLVGELRRRHVFKVVGAYIVGMWIALQVAGTMLATWDLPGWWMRAMTVLALLGIPIVATLAWAYEIEPGGIVRDNAYAGLLRMPRARRALAPAIVLGVTIMATVTGVAWWRSMDDGSRGAPQSVVAQTSVRVNAPALSIAVLPLTDMSPDGRYAYLGDGLSEELATQLASMPGLRVAARTSTFEYKGKNLDVRKIGSALGVRYLLEGSVNRADDRLRVTVQLIDANDGYHVWAETYDREWRDVFAVQDDISRQVTRALRIVLTPESNQLARGGEAPNVDAYDRYLAGVAALRQPRYKNQAAEAEELFRQALELDPTLAQAHAGLCEVGVDRYSRTKAKADLETAEAECQQALSLNKSLKETALALGRLYSATGRSADAEAMYRDLIRRHPKDVEAHLGLAEVLEATKRPEEAEAELRVSVEMDPGYWKTHADLGMALFRAGRMAEAEPEFRKAAELVPTNATMLGNLGNVLWLRGQLESARLMWERSVAIEPTHAAHSNLGTLYYFLGRFSEAAIHYEQALAAGPKDFILEGSLADAYWMIPGRREDARRLYASVATLAALSLKQPPRDSTADSKEAPRDPIDPAAWAMLAYFQGRTGNSAESAQSAQQAMRLGQNDMYAQYYLALLHADRSDTRAASAYAQRAKSLGYPPWLLKVDPVLRPLLRTDPGDTARVNRQ